MKRYPIPNVAMCCSMDISTLQVMGLSINSLGAHQQISGIWSSYKPEKLLADKLVQWYMIWEYIFWECIISGVHSSLSLTVDL